MILKLIPLDLDKAGRKSKATNIADLTEYIAAPDDTARLNRIGYHIDQDGVIHGGDGEQPEKVLYLTSRGFNTRTFKGQQAEMVTDSLRALLLEANGYDAQVFEFVALEHTSKNKMILAVRRPAGTRVDEARRAQVLGQIAEIKAFYGIHTHCLESLLQADAAPA